MSLLNIMQTDLTVYFQDNIKRLKLILNQIKQLEKHLKRKKNSLDKLKKLYDSGFIDEIEYRRISEDLKRDIHDLEIQMIELVGRAREILEELNSLLKFDKEVHRIGKRRVIQIRTSEIEKVLYDTRQIIQQYNHIEPPKDLVNPSATKTKIKVGKRFLQIKKVLFSRKDTKKESIKIKTRPPKKRNLNIDYKQYLVRFASRWFGKVAGYLIKNFPELYTFIYELLKKAGIKMTVRTYISLILTIFLLALVPTLVLTIFIIKNILFLPILFTLVTALFTLFTIYYPTYIRKSKAEEIRSMLPFAIIHMASLAKAGLKPKDIFKVIAETKEYKLLSEEFQKLVDYIDMGMSLSEAIRTVANDTPSGELKEFLEGLLLSLQSGSNLREYLEISAESAIIHYKSLNQKFIQTIKTFSDIYVGMVVTMPMILVSVIIMLASLAERVFGLPIPTLTMIIVYLLVPAVNIAMLLLISKIQPK
ncbi:MAG TPA: hypothetical protein EYH22_02470 [Candidatus Nanopusillus sp.]|nr:hypothetical protein [Candidatus Nanopusillus sp.]